MAKAESKAKRWKQESKVGVEKIELEEKKGDEAKQEAKEARLVAVAAGQAKAKTKDDLTGVRDALVARKEDGCGLEAEIVRLTVERMSLLLELEASRDEVSAFHS